MVYKLKRVAIIGAGVSGLTAARHLLSEGLDVLVYERSSRVGGVWSYDERQPPEPNYPSMRPSVADFIPETDADSGETRLVPLDELQNVELRVEWLPVEENIGDFANVRLIGELLQGYASHFDVNSRTKFNTRVEKVEKVGDKWELRSSTLIRDEPERGTKRYEIDIFDAVVVASGHYHACRVPDIPGLSQWKKAFPDRVHHSKLYRKPDGFKNKTILLIGAGVSSTDIANEAHHFTNQVYQSSRGGAFDIPLAMLPEKTIRVAGIASFSPPSPPASPSSPLGTVTLTDGTILSDIDAVVICIGYHMTYHFLTSVHSDPESSPSSRLAPSKSDAEAPALPHILVTTGTQTHNLHQDIFYIPDPTLAFIGIPFYGATFTLFEFQSVVVARVFSGHAWLPSREEMVREYEKKKARKGSGRAFHIVLGEEETEYVRGLVEWVNYQGEVTGGERVAGNSEAWLEGKRRMVEKRVKMLEVKGERWSGLDGGVAKVATEGGEGMGGEIGRAEIL